MSNLRLIMKFADGRLAWSERHWFYAGPPTPGNPPVSPTPTLAPVVPMADAIVQLRLGCLPTTSQLIGATLSFDDAARDGSFIAGTLPGLFAYSSGTPVLDPELSVMCNASSRGNVTLQSRFFVAPTMAQAVKDQIYDPSYSPTWNQDLMNYLNALWQAPGVTGLWGWKAAQYQASMGSNFVGNASPLIVNTSGFLYMTVTTATVNAFIQTGNIVKVSGIVQTQGAAPRLNGRWYVQNVLSTTEFVLTRKNSRPWWNASSANYVGGGFIVPQYNVIVPYTYIAPLRLVKKDRGGTLGLPRGRARTQRSNV